MRVARVARFQGQSSHCYMFIKQFDSLKDTRSVHSGMHMPSTATQTRTYTP